MHARTDLQLGTSIKVMLQSINLIIGVNKSILEVPFTDYGYLAEIKQDVFNTYGECHKNMKSKYIEMLSL